MVFIGVGVVVDGDGICVGGIGGIWIVGFEVLVDCIGGGGYCI